MLSLDLCGSPPTRDLEEAVRQCALAVVHVGYDAEVANGFFVVRAQVQLPVASPFGALCCRPSGVQATADKDDHCTAASSARHFVI